MSLFRIIFVLCLLGAGYQFLKSRSAKLRSSAAAAVASATASPRGFVPLPAPKNAVDRNKVLIVAPPFPHAAGRRADDLKRLLAGAGVPYERIYEIAFSATSETEVDQLSVIMDGELPIVFIRGKAKNNPSLDDILAEYRAAR